MTPSRRRLLDVAAELPAHGREHLVGEVRPSLGREAFVEGGRQHVGGHPLVHGGDGGPAALARVRHPAPECGQLGVLDERLGGEDRKSTRLNSSHSSISYAVFCLKKKKKKKKA